MRKISLATLLVLFAVLLAGTGAAAGYLYPASTDNPLVTRGCVIRFDQKSSSGRTVPRIHANSSHYCIGVQRVYAEYPSGDLIIVGENLGPIVSINITVDETLTAKGIRCGPSGGQPIVRVQCYNGNGTKVKAYGASIYGTYSNLWYSDISWAAS